jgi:hypothetical protein
MCLDESSGTDAFLIESCPPAIQALYLLSLKQTLSAHRTEMSCIHGRNFFFAQR